MFGVSFCGCCCCVDVFGCEGFFCGCVVFVVIFVGEGVFWFCVGDFWFMFGCSWLVDEDDEDGEVWGGLVGIGVYFEIVFYWCVNFDVLNFG